VGSGVGVSVGVGVGVPPGLNLSAALGLPSGRVDNMH